MIVLTRRKVFRRILIGLLTLVSPRVGAEQSKESDLATDTGDGENLPPSRCLWTQQPGPVPGLLTHRQEKVDMLQPLRELIAEWELLKEEKIFEHEKSDYIWSPDPIMCTHFGDPIAWEDYRHNLGSTLSSTDKLIMSSLITKQSGGTVCISDKVVNTGDDCKQGFIDMQEKENILFLGSIEEDIITGAYLSNEGTIGYLFDIQGENVTGRFVCRQTGISRAYFGLITSIKNAINEYVNMVNALEFEPETDIIEGCPNFLSVTILKQSFQWGYGENVNQSLKEDVLLKCNQLWDNNKKRSLFSYLFEDDHSTLMGILSSSNLNLKNIRILDKNLRSYVNWNTRMVQSLKIFNNHFKEELKHVKNSIILMANFDLLEKFENNRHASRIMKFQLLFSIFNRAEHLVSEGRRLIKKVLRGLSHNTGCVIDKMGKISCQEDEGILSIQRYAVTIVTKARRLEIKQISQANCLFLDSGEIFEGNSNIFVSNGEFYHSPQLSVSKDCATKMNDSKFSCTQYFKTSGGKGWYPDQLNEEVFYILTKNGVYLQNMGGPTKLIYGRQGENSMILTKSPTWISNFQFPIQLAGGQKFDFNNLMSISKEIELDFKILQFDRKTHFDYTKYKKLHQSTFTSINLEQFYGSFSKLFKNNFSVRIISVAGLVSMILVLIICILFCTYCCSKSESGNRRYQKYSNRHGGIEITGRSRNRDTLPTAPPEEPKDRPTARRSRERPDSNKERLQRLLNRL